jgi:hypothetical protein
MDKRNNKMNIQQILDWLKEQEKGEAHSWYIVSLELFSDGTGRVVSSALDKPDTVTHEFDSLEELQQLILPTTKLEIQNVSIKPKRG